MNETKRTIPLDLQFFADSPQAESSEPEQKPEETPKQEPEQKKADESKPKEPTVQELMVELAKVKRAQEKAASEAADYKKKYNATLSEKEQASIEKAEKEAEREQQFNELLRENKINKLEKNFVLLGYDEEQALRAATAQYDGDTDTLFKVQQEVQQALIKKKEEEWLKSRPPINAGAGNGNEEDPFLKGFQSVNSKYYGGK